MKMTTGKDKERIVELEAEVIRLKALASVWRSKSQQLEDLLVDMQADRLANSQSSAHVVSVPE